MKDYNSHIINGNLIFGGIGLALLIYSSMSNPTGSEVEFLVLIGFFLPLSIWSLSLLFRSREERKGKITYDRFSASASLLFAWSIAAYALNKTIGVFADFPFWLDSMVVLLHGTMLYVPFRKALPEFVKIPVIMVAGISTSLLLYQSICSVPIIPYGLMGSLVFGIGVPIFVPILSFIFVIFLINRLIKNDENLKPYAIASIVLPLLMIIGFGFYMNSLSKDIDRVTQSYKTQVNQELPLWVGLAQIWDDSPLLGIMLKQKKGWNRSMMSFAMHDPIQELTQCFGAKIMLDRNDADKILDSKFDARHESEPMLWSSDKLETSEIITNIQVFPDYRLAYLEKILKIKSKRSWGQQEAFYTFHLPEGSVATSLSLWIEGIEEHSRLTTKAKADSAYTTIVGRERRDPALLHWQEGSRITVRVFPCTNKEEREFKVGFTIPLEIEAEDLVLKNVYFEGPKISASKEKTVIRFESEHQLDYDLPRGFEKITKTQLEKEGSYLPYWEIKMTKTPASLQPFSFNGDSYQVYDAKPKVAFFDPNIYYLDINSEWSVNELNQIFKALEGKTKLVYYEKFHTVTSVTDPLIKKILLKNRFSLFPIHHISNPQHSMLITKSVLNSPILADLKESLFMDHLKEYLIKDPKALPTFHIGAECSPYLSSLKELGVLQLVEGKLPKLIKYLSEHKFPKDEYKFNHIPIGKDGLVIHKYEGLRSVDTEAPDHLMRLFNYNKIMRELDGRHFTDQKFDTGTFIDLATAANVATPISSMIVLETLKDYERFDIKKSKNSLQNAKVKVSGGAPEPHEWALIFVGLLTLLFVKLKSR